MWWLCPFDGVLTSVWGLPKEAVSRSSDRDVPASWCLLNDTRLPTCVIASASLQRPRADTYALQGPITPTNRYISRVGATGMAPTNSRTHFATVTVKSDAAPKCGRWFTSPKYTCAVGAPRLDWGRPLSRKLSPLQSHLWTLLS